MKIAIISDIHGNGYALQQVLGDARQRNVDQYYFLGDYITDGPNVNSILNTVRDLGDIVLAGNREEYMIHYDENKDERWANTLQYQSYYYTYQRIKPDNLTYIASLPIAELVNVEGVKILLYHGIPNKTRQVFVPARDQELAIQLIREFDADVYIGGHTHVAYTYEVEGRAFFNPGSVGVPIRSKGINYSILEVRDGSIHWEQLTLPYDRQEMIARLKENKTHYLKSVGFWSELYFQSLQLNKDVVYDFLSIAYDLADIKAVMGETKDIDDETFQKAIMLYQQKKAQ